MTKEITTVENVRGYVDDNGTVWLNAEDVSRGLGFTHKQTVNGKEYLHVRWSTVNGYLKEFGFCQDVGKDDFIPENMFYRLAMKASNATAQKFQAKVADEILPAIRKTGYYSVKPLTALEMWRLALQAAEEHEKRINSLEQVQVQQQASLQKLLNAHNGVALRNEFRNNDQDKQIEQNTNDIADIRKSVFELLSQKQDISTDIDIMIKQAVIKYSIYQDLSDKEKYKQARLDFYEAVSERAGKIKSYISSMITRQRNNLIKNGISESTAKKRVNGNTVINDNINLKNAAIAIMADMAEDLNRKD